MADTEPVAASGGDGTAPSPLVGFAALGVAPEILSVLTALGYEEPTPIQREAIPPLLAGRDLLGQAATGTGKTAAFALPLLQSTTVEEPKPNRPRALVLVPTRELAMQVAEAIHKYGKERRATVLPIYGGQSIGQQLRGLDRGVSSIVATPGRALDHLERGSISFEDLRMVVLDEADEMLNMGFAEDLDAILKRAPASRQTALFSATLPPRILAIAGRHLKDPVRITIARERPVAGELPRVRQTAYIVARPHKAAALGRVLDMETPTLAIVFCRTRLEVEELQEAMSAHGYRAEALHGGLAQEQRDRVMKRFRGGKADLLIATDVAARGLDIDSLSHVVNYDCPSEPEAYVHRIGRTGRAGREGVAITLVEPREHRLLRNIEFLTRQKITIAAIPTVADLRHRRLELTRAQVKEAMVAGDLEIYRSLVEALASDADIMDVAAAAMKLAHLAGREESGAPEDEMDVPAPMPPRPGPRDRGPRADRPPRSDDGSDGAASDTPPRLPTDGPPQGFESTRLFIGAGRFGNIRPGDLVGAIAGETGLRRDVVGSIHIADRFSIVEVRADCADQIIAALRATKLRGKRVPVRRDREV